MSGEGLHPRDQWFRVLDGATWKPQGAKLHVHHPDYYGQDPRKRLAHHRKVVEAGVAVAACGLEYDPRLAVIEEHDESNRCAKCVKVTKAAK